MPDVIDADATEVGTELVHAAPVAPPSTLFRTDEPAEVLKRAVATAEALKPVLVSQQMIQRIGSNDHVKIDGWQTLGQMLGVTAVGVWTHKLDGGWEAKVNAQTLDGRVIGSAEAMCLKVEDNWKDSDEYAIRSMAQTRAASKALASVLRFVVTLAGFSGTPAEEMPSNARGGGGGVKNSTQPATSGQTGYLFGRKPGDGLLAKASYTPDELERVKVWLRDGGNEPLKGRCSEAIELLKDKGADGRAQLLTLSGVTDSPAPDMDGLVDEPHPEDDGIEF